MQIRFRVNHQEDMILGLPVPPCIIVIFLQLHGYTKHLSTKQGFLRKNMAFFEVRDYS